MRFEFASRAFKGRRYQLAPKRIAATRAEFCHNYPAVVANRLKALANR